MRTRKGLSTVVGTVFAIIALTTTITYVSYSMGVLDNYNQSVLTKNQQLSDVNKEKFQISSVTVPNSKLNITVVNTGSVPINFTKIWIQNMSSTDWVNSYTPTNNFVVPGGVLTKIGQNIPAYINSANSYNIKLVTSRGNTQQFTVNSANGAKLNIQMMFLPPTISSGFTSELLMVVINNSTSTLTNISPSDLPAATNGTGNTGNLKCIAGSVSPTSYNTLAPGSAAFFTWTISTTNGNPSDTCTYNLTTPLQNGYTQSVSPSMPLTITSVNLASTTYAQNSGVITNDYTKFKWTQGSNTWNTEWSFPSCATTDFQITVQNNNQTGGGYYLWLSKNSQIFFVPTILTNIPNQKMTPQTYYIVNSVTTNPLGISTYADNSIGIRNQGGIATLYFGAASAGGSQQATSTCSNNYPYGLSPNTPYYGSIVLYGKFTKNAGDTNGGNYAQAIPFMAVISN